MLKSSLSRRHFLQVTAEYVVHQPIFAGDRGDLSAALYLGGLLFAQGT